MLHRIMLALLLGVVVLVGSAPRLAATAAPAYQIVAPPTTRVGEPISVLVSLVVADDRPDGAFATLAWSGPVGTGVGVDFTGSPFQLDGGLCDTDGKGCEWRLSAPAPLGPGEHPVVSLTVVAPEPGIVTIDVGDAGTTIRVTKPKGNGQAKR